MSLSGKRYFIRARYLLSVPFWIQTPTHPCTSHPLHSLEHNIYFHDLPFSLLSSRFFTIPAELLMVRLAAGLEHGRVYANVEGVTISDPDCNVTVVMFWFAYFSVVFFIHKIYIRRRKQWCLRLTVCHFHIQNSYYSTMPR